MYGHQFARRVPPWADVNCTSQGKRLEGGYARRSFVSLLFVPTGSEGEPMKSRDLPHWLV